MKSFGAKGFGIHEQAVEKDADESRLHACLLADTS